MDDLSRPAAEQFQDSTRWLLMVLVAVSVLAAGVVAATGVPDLVGRRWQLVGSASMALTLLALLVATYVVLRSLDPAVDDPVGASEAAERLAVPAVVVPEATAPAARTAEVAVLDDGAAPDGGDAVEETDGPGPIEVPDDHHPDDQVPPVEAAALGASVADGGRRSHRQAAGRFRRARSSVGAAVVLAFLGMAGMTVASVVDGNKVEDRQRRTLAAELARDEQGPIVEPQAVSVQLTTQGLQRVAEAMGCTGGDIGLRPVQGWAVSGTFREPTVVLFGPVPTCDNIQMALVPADGFVFPTGGVPTTVPRPADTPPTTGAPAAPPTTAPAGFGPPAPATAPPAP